MAGRTSTNDEKTGLPFVDIPMTAQPLFPSYGRNRKAILYINNVFYYLLRPGGAPPKASLLDTYLLLTSTHMYLMDDDTACHRCLALSELVSVKAPKDVTAIKASLGKELTNNRALTKMQAGCIYTFRSPEPEVYIGFTSYEEQVGFAKRVGRIVEVPKPQAEQRRNAGHHHRDPAREVCRLVAPTTNEQQQQRAEHRQEGDDGEKVIAEDH